MTDRYGAGLNCSSGKRSFPTRRAAKKWMRSRRTTAGLPRRIYTCPECGQVHMTTYTAEETRQIREKRAREQ